MTHNSDGSVIDRLPSASLQLSFGAAACKDMDRLVAHRFRAYNLEQCVILRRGDRLWLADDPLRSNCGFSA